MNDITLEDEDDAWARQEAEEARKEARRAEPPPPLSPEEFASWRSPRTVSGGPVSLDNPLWHWLVRTGFDAYSANEKFHGPSAFGDGPMWCFDRFGQSVTELPDGRRVHVGGEHEDFYDPDFFIYNDVVVIDPDGGIRILGYGREQFPPTDFHSASQIGNTLYLVGCLGYEAQRQVGVTPVFALDLEQMNIRALPTRGDGPGWIHAHAAEVAPDGRTLIVSGGEVWRGKGLSFQQNIDRWSLNVDSGRWERLTALDWQRWTMLPVNRKRNRLFDLRHELFARDYGMGDWRYEEPPDFEALAALYRVDEDAPPPREGQDYNEYIAEVDGIRVRFTEERCEVKALVEGRLPQDRLEAFQRKTLATLERLNASPWEIEADTAA